MGPTQLGLGIDAGGTQTRWALARPSGEIVASGQVAGFSGLQMSTAAGQERIAQALTEIAGAVLQVGRPAEVVAGMTGFTKGEEEARLTALIAEPLGLSAETVSLSGDMEIAYRDVFSLGEGYLVYAGTGSTAAYIDDSGVFHRVGGRGGVLDDAGGGFWIAREALRHVWRAEDERPGSFRESAMATALFGQIGGSDWPATRDFVYAGGFETNRGKVGRLALVVAKAADADPAARAILTAAGEELARLGAIFTRRFGPRPIALSGRVVELHPIIEQAMRAGLPEDTTLTIRVSEGHAAAARVAAKRIRSKAR